MIGQRTIRACLPLALSWAFQPAAARPIDVVRVDGFSQQCVFVRATPDVVVLHCDQPMTLRHDALARLDFRRPITGAAPGGAVFYLNGGGRLHGTIAGGEHESVVVNTSVADGLEIGLSSLAGVWFGAGAPDARVEFDQAMGSRLPGKDTLLIEREGVINAVRGSVVSLGADGGALLLNRKEFDFRREGLIGIVLASGVGEKTRWPVLLRLVDGTELPGRVLEGDDDRLVFATSFGGEVVIPATRVASIRFYSERVLYLSALTPARDESSGLLHRPWATRFDRSVMNGPISLDGKTYDRGIGVHADATLEYDIGGGYETFAATIGIDDAVRPRGTVRFRVEGDGRELFDSGIVTGEHEARNIVVDVRGVSRLSLVVLNGDGLDLSDHADWADARLIKPREED